MDSSVCIDINDDSDDFNFQNLSNYFDKIDNKYIKTHMKQISNIELIQNLCYIQQKNHIIINYPYFKYITKNNIYNGNEIIQYLINVMQNVLTEYKQFIVHLNTNNLNLIDVEKYYLFIQQISQVMKDQFPEKMKTCYIYNAPYIFSKIFSIISIFIDKKTLQKIKIMDTD
jgi:hypothetical protein